MLNMWRKARKKPVIIEFREVKPNHADVEIIDTGHGEAVAHPKLDFIIKDECGEYPIRKGIFEKTYDIITVIETWLTNEPETVQEKTGVCVFCGKSEHKDLEKMDDHKLLEEILRMMQLTTIEVINEFNDQQGNIGRVGCVQFEIRRRETNENSQI